MKSLMAISCSVLLALSQQASAQQSQIRTYSQKTLLKNWALSRCLAEVNADGPAKDDANATAGAYLEFGRQSIEVYGELSKLVNKYVKLTYAGSVESSFNTMKCIDLFHSRELDRLASELAKKRTR